MGPQTPSTPWPLSIAEQAEHVPVHALSQQTPSTQNVLSHSLPSVHGVPFTAFCFGTVASSPSEVSTAFTRIRKSTADGPFGTSSANSFPVNRSCVSICSDEPFFTSVTRSREAPRSSMTTTSSPSGLARAPTISQRHVNPSCSTNPGLVKSDTSYPPSFAVQTCPPPSWLYVITPSDSSARSKSSSDRSNTANPSRDAKRTPSSASTGSVISTGSMLLELVAPMDGA